MLLDALIARCLYLIAFLIGTLPLPVLRKIGGVFGRVSYALNSREARVTRVNLDLIKLEQHNEQRDAQIKAVLQASAATAFETLAIWTRRRARVLHWVDKVHGKHFLDAAIAQQRGVILAVPHYGNWELLIEYMANRGPFSLVYRVPKKPFADKFLRLARGGHNVRLVPAEATAMRPLLRALHNNEIIGITPDQQPKMGGGEFAAFYGLPALTLSLIPKLAQRTVAPVVFAFTEPTEHGFDVHFQALAPELQTPDLPAALTAMNRRVQAIADRNFRYYQWTYKRFSIRPDSDEKNWYN